jgi:L,D-peptidoglycan transpeptidase YkuD (ErfK/YbiS/YcfS/YnhG family)
VSTARRLAALAVTLMLALTLSPAPSASAATVRLDGVTVVLQPGTSQVITVNRTRSWHARVTFWRKTTSGWQSVLRSGNGRIGYGGLVVGAKRKQGTGTTPLGSYRLLATFGTHVRGASWDLPYRRIRAGDYWVEDNQSAYYNRYRNKSQGGFRWWLRSGQNTSERLADFPTQYEYAVNTGFNRSQVRHRGAGIFLHVNGRGATAGCVSAPRAFMRSAMVRLDPARVPVIAIGR